MSNFYKFIVFTLLFIFINCNKNFNLYTKEDTPPLKHITTDEIEKILEGESESEDSKQNEPAKLLLFEKCINSKILPLVSKRDLEKKVRLEHLTEDARILLSNETLYKIVNNGFNDKKPLIPFCNFTKIKKKYRNKIYSGILVKLNIILWSFFIRGFLLDKYYICSIYNLHYDKHYETLDSCQDLCILEYPCDEKCFCLKKRPLLLIISPYGIFLSVLLTIFFFRLIYKNNVNPYNPKIIKLSNFFNKICGCFDGNHNKLIKNMELQITDEIKDKKLLTYEV